MKKTKSLTALLLVAVLLFGAALPVSASNEGIMPVLENCDMCLTSFTITNGTATIIVDYTGNESTFKQITVFVKIQKKVLGIFWSTVDIGYTDNLWTATSYDYRGFLFQNIPISQTGSYRARFDIFVYGNNGSFDHIEHDLYFEYNG